MLPAAALSLQQRQPYAIVLDIEARFTDHLATRTSGIDAREVSGRPTLSRHVPLCVLRLVDWRQGTTTPITFVKDTLFPYARARLESFLRCAPGARRRCCCALHARACMPTRLCAAATPLPRVFERRWVANRKSLRSDLHFSALQGDLVHSRDQGKYCPCSNARAGRREGGQLLLEDPGVPPMKHSSSLMHACTAVKQCINPSSGVASHLRHRLLSPRAPLHRRSAPLLTTSCPSWTWTRKTPISRISRGASGRLGMLPGSSSDRCEAKLKLPSFRCTTRLITPLRYGVIPRLTRSSTFSAQNPCAGGCLPLQVFDDVPRALAGWASAGVKVYVYSSGSRQAQRLIFGARLRSGATALAHGAPPAPNSTLMVQLAAQGKAARATSARSSLGSSMPLAWAASLKQRATATSPHREPLRPSRPTRPALKRQRSYLGPTQAEDLSNVPSD